MIDLNGDIYSHLLSELRDGIYYEAASCYYTEPSDNNRIIHLLKDVDTAREQFLCGYSYFETKQYDDALRKMNAAFQDSEYLSSKKNTVEEGILATTMHTFSAMERLNGNFEKAVLILNHAIEAISDEEMREHLRKELRRYQKKMFGGWKYT